MGANKRLEIAKAPEAANADASENKMDQIRELMFGGGWKIPGQLSHPAPPRHDEVSAQSNAMALTSRLSG